MSLIEQLNQVIAYAVKEAEFACVHHYRYEHLEEIASRLSAIVEQMRAGIEGQVNAKVSGAGTASAGLPGYA